MEIFLALLLAIAAGTMNGSYAFPVKNIRIHWQNNIIWLFFSVFAFLISPWAANLLINPSSITFLLNIDIKVLIICAFAGLAFGSGMVLFTFGLKYLGIGISFLLNIGTGTVIATLLRIILWKINLLKTRFGFLEYSAMVFFIIGIILSIYACHRRDKNKENNTKIGVIYALLSGVLTSSQGFAYNYTLPFIKNTAHLLHYSSLSSVNIQWIIIFNFAFIPYAAYFCFSSLRNKEFCYAKNSFFLNITRIIIDQLLIHSWR